MPILFADLLQFVFGALMFTTAIFLILLVLVQRGRGGGLSGAFGGMGGQSAFGTKAGDLFTRITVGVAAFWILLCVVAIKVLNQGSGALPGSPTEGIGAQPTTEAGMDPGAAPGPEGATPETETGETEGAGGVGGSGDDSTSDSDSAPSGAGSAPAVENGNADGDADPVE